MRGITAQTPLLSRCARVCRSCALIDSLITSAIKCPNSLTIRGLSYHVAALEKHSWMCFIISDQQERYLEAKKMTNGVLSSALLKQSSRNKQIIFVGWSLADFTLATVSSMQQFFFFNVLASWQEQNKCHSGANRSKNLPWSASLTAWWWQKHWLRTRINVTFSFHSCFYDQEFALDPF